MRRRTAAGLMASGLTLALSAGLGLTTSASAVDGGAGPGASPDRSPTSAQRVLKEAQKTFSDPADGAHGTREATLVLRDLMTARPQLSGADRDRADTLLSRPSTPPDNPSDPYDVYYGNGAEVETACGDDVCLHWVESGDHATVDPAYRALTLETLNEVHDAYEAAGYRSPLPDGAAGGDNRTDVYLANVDALGLYGYCTSDEPLAEGKYAYWAYCVLDNDYALFDNRAPEANMRVTAAHEYYHAVQFAYDALEDGWLMENTATWAEDELFDDVNDNYSYLEHGQMGASQLPLDTMNTEGLEQYGNWTLFRMLSEKVPGEQGGMSDVVRRIWENADSTNGAENDQYSLQAVASAVKDAAGISFGTFYTLWSTANREPDAYYEEGSAYPVPPAFATHSLTPGSPGTGTRTVLQDHLTADTVVFNPSRKMKAGWKLKVAVDMGSLAQGSNAVISVFHKDGATDIRPLKLSSKGIGALKVPFDSRTVSRVELTLVNASTRTQCWNDNAGPLYFSCFGTPLDEQVRQTYAAAAVR